jgi:hypothetical protein
MMHDYLSAELDCPACGKRRKHLVQTCLFGRDQQHYEVGDPIEGGVASLSDHLMVAGDRYRTVERNLGREPEHVSVLELSSCGDCNAEMLVRADIDGGTVTGITPIIPSSATLAPVTRVSIDVSCKHFFEPIVERMFEEATQEEFYIALMTTSELIAAIVDRELDGELAAEDGS